MTELPPPGGREMRVMGRSVSEFPALGLAAEAKRFEDPGMPVARGGEGAGSGGAPPPTEAPGRLPPPPPPAATATRLKE